MSLKRIKVSSISEYWENSFLFINKMTEEYKDLQFYAIFSEWLPRALKAITFTQSETILWQ
jgi:hypothetical protein